MKHHDDELEGMGAPREVWFESQGVRLYALDAGSGPPLVFLHGGLADHRAALAHVDGLAESQRLLAPDLRGSGRSAYSGELSWDLLAEDVRALLDHVGATQCIVGGVSAGSAVALRFVLRYPEKSLGLVLVAPVYAGEERGLTPAQVAAMHAMAEAGQRGLEHGIEALVPLYERLPPPIRERAVEMVRTFDPASVAATTRFLASGAQPFSSLRDLEAIERPVLLVPGTDPEHPPELAALYAGHLRHHTMLDPAGSAVAERISSFCAELDSSSH